jgi:excisionase family DNA binding protein
MTVADHFQLRVERRFYTPTQAAEILGISRSKIYEMMQSGEIPFETYGGARRISVLFVGMIVAEAETRARESAEHFANRRAS